MSRSLLDLGKFALLLLAAGAMTSCGDDEPAPRGEPFAQAKRELERIVRDSATAVLPEVEGQVKDRPPVPCRSAGGTGPGSGEFLPDYALQFDLAGEEPRELIDRVADHWRAAGFQNVQLENLDGADPTVSARDGQHNLAFSVFVKSGVAELGASGPCVQPGEGEDVGSP